MNRYQVIYRPRGTTDPWESMGTTFDSRNDAIEAVTEYGERWADREFTVVELTPERVAELAAVGAKEGSKTDKHEVSATMRARLILDCHTAMTRRDPSECAARLADVIAALLTLACHWGLATGPLLEEAHRQACGAKHTAAVTKEETS